MTGLSAGLDFDVCVYNSFCLNTNTLFHLPFIELVRFIEMVCLVSSSLALKGEVRSDDRLATLTTNA